jgi:hypothetical protein
MQQAEAIEREGAAALERLRVHPIHAQRLPYDVRAALLADAKREKRFAANRAFAERHIPALQVVGTPAGHAVNIEAAAEFNAAVVDFVVQHTSTAW